MFTNKFKNFGFFQKSGFTLVEIMVSISIVAVLSVAVLFSYRQFNDRVALSAGVQEMMLALRQSQIYGLSVREASAGQGQFNYGYGVYIDMADPSNYYIFIDKNSNKVYDKGNGCGGSNTECVETIKLRDQVTISDICNASDCPPNPSVKMLDITFLRPNPDADINFTNNGGNIWSGSQSLGKVVLKSGLGKTASVVVESTGQIYSQ